MLTDLRELVGARELLATWVFREVRVRYRQSLLGIAWAVFQPITLTIAYTVVFSYFIRVPTGGVPYPVFVFAALLPWSFFAASMTTGTSSLVTNFTLITKIYFPREILPLGAVGVALVDFVMAAGSFALMLAWFQIPPSWSLLWVPYLIVIQVVVTLGFVLPLAALNVLYRDVRFLVQLGIQLWLYATPIIYPIDVVPERLLPLYALNPLVGIVDSYRRVTVLGVPPDPVLLGLSTIVGCVLAVAGYAVLKRFEDSFADLI